MPIYEYECTACHNIIEVFQRMTEEPLCSCPDCSGSLKKLVSMSSFQLKGGGWYADGYSSKSTDNSSSASNNNGNGSKQKAEKSVSSTPKKPDSSIPAKTKKNNTATA